MRHCKLNTYDNIFPKLCHMKNVAQTITNILWPENYKSNQSPNILFPRHDTLQTQNKSLYVFESRKIIYRAQIWTLFQKHDMLRMQKKKKKSYHPSKAENLQIY